MRGAGVRTSRMFRGGDDDRFVTRVAWLYYVEGMTQAEIAEHLGVTRLRINRVLAMSRKTGIVQVRINSPHAHSLELERRLVDTFGLDAAVVMPAPVDPEAARNVAALALSSYISELIADPAVASIGVGWGVTLREAVWNLEDMHRADLEVVSMLGGMTRGSEFNAIEITGQLASRIGARCTYLPAPLYASTEQSRDTIMAQDVFKEVLEKMRRVDAAIFSAGDMSERSLLIRYALPRDITLSDLAEAGAVGDIAGQMLDANGRLIDHPINRRVIGAALHELRAIPRVILAAAGTHKVPVITAVLRSKVLNVLLTDEHTASAVLERHRTQAAAE